MARFISILLSTLFFFFPHSALSKEHPTIITTIAPLHSLITGIVGEHGNVELLVEGHQSPHDFHLKPSDIRKISKADIVIYLDDNFETFLRTTLSSLSKRPTILEIIKHMEEIRWDPPIIPLRDMGSHHHHHEHTFDENTLDMHIWLNPVYAKHIVIHVRDLLEKHSPQFTEHYRKNTEALLQRIDALDKELSNIIRPVQHRPFLAFHDMLQYFEKRYDVNMIAPITLNPSLPSTPQHIAHARKMLEQSKAKCVLKEPQFSTKIIDVVAEDFDINVSIVDPHGASLTPGRDLYFLMMEQMAKNIATCLRE